MTFVITNFWYHGNTDLILNLDVIYKIKEILKLIFRIEATLCLESAASKQDQSFIGIDFIYSESFFLIFASLPYHFKKLSLNLSQLNIIYGIITWKIVHKFYFFKDL